VPWTLAVEPAATTGWLGAEDNSNHGSTSHICSILFYFGRVFWYRLSTFILILVLVTHTLKEMCTPYLIGMVNIYTATLAMEKYGGPAT
jgi:hypothetical protein